MVRKLTILLLLCLGALHVQAFQFDALVNSDTLISKSWTIDDGLPVNTLNNVVQDEEGHLWIATYDGLVRFDGEEFDIFNHANTPVIPHNRMVKLFFQEGVGMWITLEYGGVLLYKNGAFSHFGEEQGFTDGNIFKYQLASQGSVYFFTTKGLYKYQNSVFSKFYTSSNELREYVYDLFEDEDGSCWLATNSGLVHKTKDGVDVYSVGNLPSENVIYFARKIRAGNFLVGTLLGLYEFKNGKFYSEDSFRQMDQVAAKTFYEDDQVTLISSPDGIWELSDGKVEKLKGTQDFKQVHYDDFYRDTKGTLWLVGEMGEIATLQAGIATPFKEIPNAENYRINDFFEDIEGNFWLLTYRNGLVRIKESKVRTIGRKEGLSEDNILALLEDSKGRLWVGTRGGGLNKIEQNSITHYTLYDSISTNVIQALREDNDGRIWIGNYQKGIDIYDNGRFDHIDIGRNVDANDIRSILFTKSGDIWIGTYGGLVKLDQNTLEPTLFTQKNGLSGQKVRYIIEAVDQSMWIGTLDGGVSRYKNGRFTAYTTHDGLSSNNIRSIYEDKDDPGTMWVGTENNGLNRIRGNSIKFINGEDGLPDYNIHWISQDSHGWLWMLSNRGVFKIKKEQLNEYLDGRSSSFQIIEFGKEDGMRNPEGNGSFQEAGIQSKSGDFIFATQAGISIFSTKEADPNVFNPTIKFINILAGGHEYPTDTLKLEPEVDDIQIQVRAIEFSSPEKTKYRYRLSLIGEEGSKKDWVETGKNNSFFFNELRPGRYQFNVQATNNEGAWSPNTGSIVFEITPKFYQKIWFWAFLVVLIVVAAYQYSVFRNKVLIKKQREMQAVIEEQTKALRLEKQQIEQRNSIIEQQAEALRVSNTTKDRFFSIIAHDLKNPFQAMLFFSEDLYKSLDKVSKDELKERIGIIKESSNRLYKLTDNLLQWARLQSKQVEPDRTVFSVDDLIKSNIELIEQLAQRKDITLSWEVENGLQLFADKNMMDTVIRNLLSNAIKFTRKGGRVCVNAISDARSVTISISDTGIGMNEKMLENLLKLDAEVTRDGTENEKGTGLGVIICQQMVALNDGLLRVESEVGKGTTFSLSFKSVEELLNV